MLSNSEGNCPGTSDHVATVNRCYREYMEVYAPENSEEEDELVTTTHCLDLPEPIEPATGAQETKIAPPVTATVALKRQLRLSATNVLDGQRARGGGAGPPTHPRLVNGAARGKNSIIKRTRGEYKRAIFHSQEEDLRAYGSEASEGSAPWL